MVYEEGTMGNDSDLVLAILSVIVIVVSLWVVHRVHPRVPH
jgi:hypothetical protein